jgi:hypothetical protein
LEKIALFARVLEPEEVRENAARIAWALGQREPVERVILEGRLLARSRVPSLQEISPYREALAVARYAVERVSQGELEAETVRVAEWVLLDGEPIRGPSASRSLVLEPFARQPQLESVFLSDTLEEGEGGLLFYSLEP